MDFYRKYQREISYFFAGWCTLAGLTDLTNGNYVWAVIDAGLVYLNFKLAQY